MILLGESVLLARDMLVSMLVFIATGDASFWYTLNGGADRVGQRGDRAGAAAAHDGGRAVPRDRGGRGAGDLR